MQAYEQVSKYPPPDNAAYGYAFYKLGYALWNEGKLGRAVTSFQKTIEFVTADPDSPEATALKESAERNLAVVTKAAARPPADSARIEGR